MNDKEDKMRESKRKKSDRTRRPDNLEYTDVCCYYFAAWANQQKQASCGKLFCPPHPLTVYQIGIGHSDV